MSAWFQMLLYHLITHAVEIKARFLVSTKKLGSKIVGKTGNKVALLDKLILYRNNAFMKKILAQMLLVRCHHIST